MCRIEDNKWFIDDNGKRFELAEPVQEKMSPSVEKQFYRGINRMAKQFYDNPDNLAAFIEWHIKKYGFAPTKGVGIG